MRIGLFYQIQVPKPWTSTSEAQRFYEAIEQVAQEVMAEDEEFASEATTEEAETSAPAVSEETASGGSTDDDENH